MKKELNNEKKVYETLNDIKINLDEYYIEHLNDLEAKKFKKTLSKKIKASKFLNKKRLVAVSIATILSITILNTNIGVYALDSIGTISYSLSDALGLNKSLDDYKSIVNQVKAKNEVSLKLDEVILDNDELIVSYIAKSDEKISKDFGNIFLFQNLFINGKRIKNSSSSSSEKIDDNTVKCVTTYDLENEKFNGNIDVKIEFSSAMISGMKNNTEKEVKGPWIFEFKTNGDELKIKTKKFDLNNSFKLPNGQRITLNKLTINDLGSKIYYSQEKPLNGKSYKNYDILLKGLDNNGEKVEFYVSKVGNTKGVFKSQNQKVTLNKNITSFTLTPYAVEFPEKSGKMSNDFKQVGEPFKIDLKN